MSLISASFIFLSALWSQGSTRLGGYLTSSCSSSIPYKVLVSKALLCYLLSAGIPRELVPETEKAPSQF